MEEYRDSVKSGYLLEKFRLFHLKDKKPKEYEANAAKLQLTMELNNIESRSRLLAEMEKEYEGFSKAVREVMRAAQKNILRGIYGPAAGLMKVDAQYAVAIETALGAGMQNIVVDREDPPGGCRKTAAAPAPCGRAGR